MRILLFGISGQIGHEIHRYGLGKGWTIFGVGRDQVDLTHPPAIAQAIKEARPDLVVNAAAYTAVDRAESEPALANGINAEAPRWMAQSCAQAGSGLIHLSTDYVFDGSADRPYRESDPVNPINSYGRSKAAGEAAVRRSLERHIILRTAWVYSARGNNFVRTMMRLSKEGDALRIVDDQTGAPTAATSVAEAISTIVAQIAANHSVPWGTYHYVDGGQTTWYGFAQEIFELAAPYLDRPPTLIPIGTADDPVPATRPANSVLDCAKILQTFGIRQRSRHTALKAVIEDIFHGKSLLRRHAHYGAEERV